MTGTLFEKYPVGQLFIAKWCAGTRLFRVDSRNTKNPDKPQLRCSCWSIPRHQWRKTTAPAHAIELLTLAEAVKRYGKEVHE